MYSGITQGLFCISRLASRAGTIDYAVLLNEQMVQGLAVGSSVNIDGVCQTVTQINGHEVSFTAIEETCRVTTLDELRMGRLVSVERSLRYGDELGGHEIAGHVIGTATVERIWRSGDNVSLSLACTVEWMKYILPKGFIAVDGSSLTVGETDAVHGLFTVHLIPETVRQTHLGNKKIGDRVNIELDRITQIIVSATERWLAQVS
jgi:riboflavin synthase